MTIIEKIELGLIPALATLTGTWSALLPAQIGLGRLCLLVSALLLGQSLIRDLVLLARNRPLAGNSQKPAMRCLCLESTIGSSGIVAGALVLGLGLDYPIDMPFWLWSIVTAAVLTFGFVIKDYVLLWRPLGFYRDKDHINIVVKW